MVASKQTVVLAKLLFCYYDAFVKLNLSIVFENYHGPRRPFLISLARKRIFVVNSANYLRKMKTSELQHFKLYTTHSFKQIKTEFKLYKIP